MNEEAGEWGRQGSYPKLRSISPPKNKTKNKLMRYGAELVRGPVMAAAVLDLTGVGGLLHFPQLNTAVEPDDGAEGKRWQHAPIQTAVRKPSSRVLLEQPFTIFFFFLKYACGGRKEKNFPSGGRTSVVGSLRSNGEV